jgi:hypothetical protein
MCFYVVSLCLHWIFRWWKESQQRDDDETGGVLYSVSLSDAADSEIVLHLRKKEDFGKSDKAGEGFSSREYALLPEGMWLRALKW